MKLLEREYGEFGAHLVPKSLEYVKGTSVKKRGEPIHSKKMKHWIELKNKVLSIRKEAIGNKKTNKEYINLLKRLLLGKIPAPEAWNKYLEIKKKLRM